MPFRHIASLDCSHSSKHLTNPPFFGGRMILHVQMAYATKLRSNSTLTPTMFWRFVFFFLNHWIKSWCSHVKGTTPWKIQDVSYFLPHPLWFQVRGDGHSLPFTDASFDTVVGRVWLKLVDSVQSGVIFDGRLPILGLVWEESLNMTTWGLPKSCNRWKIYVICMKGTLLTFIVHSYSVLSGPKS